MANALTALSTATTTATALSNLILVSPQVNLGYQPQNTSSNNPNNQELPLPPPILFNYEGDQTVELRSDITDHFIENNSAIQDQIALRPERITTHGFIGELNDVVPKALIYLQQAAQKLTVIDAYTPVLSETAIIAYNEAFQFYQVGSNAVSAGVAAWSSINSIGTSSLSDIISIPGAVQNKQQIYFQMFYGYWVRRNLFTIQTPWAIFKNAAIESLTAIQDRETRVITDFEITFKVLRFSNTTTALGVTSQPIFTDFEGRSANQAAEDPGLVNLGTNAPASSTSLSDALSANFGVTA